MIPPLSQDSLFCLCGDLTIKNTFLFQTKFFHLKNNQKYSSKNITSYPNDSVPLFKSMLIPFPAESPQGLLPGIRRKK